MRKSQKELNKTNTRSKKLNAQSGAIDPSISQKTTNTVKDCSTTTPTGEVVLKVPPVRQRLQKGQVVLTNVEKNMLKSNKNICTFPPIAVNSSNKIDTPLPPQTSSDEEDLSSFDKSSTCSSTEINLSKNIYSPRVVTFVETRQVPLSTDGSRGMVGMNSEKENCISKQFSSSGGHPTMPTELDSQRHVRESTEVPRKLALE